jgi:hypothetical protein
MQLDEGKEIGRLILLRPKQIGVLVDGIGSILCKTAISTHRKNVPIAGEWPKPR